MLDLDAEGGLSLNSGPKIHHRFIGKPIRECEAYDLRVIASTATNGGPKQPLKAVMNAFTHRKMHVIATHGGTVHHSYDAPKRNGGAPVKPDNYYLDYEGEEQTLVEKDLKAQNMWPLTIIYGGTILLMAVLHLGLEEAFEFSRGLWEHALVVAGITVFGSVLSNVIPNRGKYVLVYWRFRNALSGHRCSEICAQDSRLHLADLQHQWPELFKHEMNADEQNAYWYKHIYSSVQNTPEVVQAHRTFLLCRDATTGLFLLFVLMVVWTVVSKTEIVSVPSVSSWSSLVPLVVGFLCSLAARQSGDRMVANAVVVALRTSKDNG